MRPRHVDEVLAVVDACATVGVPITARGAGTSIAGNSVGAGVVVDFAKHLNRVHAVDADTRTATVDPGVVHTSLQRAAAPHGLRYGPDPSSHTRCTVGGMIGNNACGNHALGYGRSSDNIAGLQVVTAAGERLTLGRDLTPTSPTLERLRSAVSGGLSTVRTEMGTFSRQVSGYSLEHLLPEHGFDVASFMAGTEGTLGVLLGATVDLVRDAPERHFVVLGYPEHGRGRRRRADDAAVRAGGLRGPQLPCRRGLSDGSRRRLGPGPAGRRRLPLRRAGRRGCRRAGGHRREGRCCIGGDGASSRRRSRRAGRPLAGSRGGRRTGRAGSRSARSVGMGGRRRASGQPRPLPARLRRADGAASRARRSVRPLRRRLCAHPHRLPARRARRPRRLPRLHHRRGPSHRVARRLVLRRAR